MSSGQSSKAVQALDALVKPFADICGGCIGNLQFATKENIAWRVTETLQV